MMPPTTERGVLAQGPSLEIAEPFPAEVPVGSEVSVQVRAAHAAGSELRGGRINVLASEEIIAAQLLIGFRDGINETVAFTLKAPNRVGEFTWTVQFPSQDINGVRYEESTLPGAFRTTPMQTSLAVWDVPSPVLIEACFAIKVGAKSSGACELKAARVEVTDEDGGKAGDGAFGDTPWPGTAALYWGEISLTAPRKEGAYSWRVAFAAEELSLPHAAASTTFGFAVVKHPEHRLTVKVMESEGAAPIANVQLGVGPYRAATDEAGEASVPVPKGRYRIDLWHPEFEFVSRELEVTADFAVEIELTRMPKERSVWD
jgi:hypothetical protein